MKMWYLRIIFIDNRKKGNEEKKESKAVTENVAHWASKNSEQPDDDRSN